MYNLSGQAWDNTDVSYSLAPDGTVWNTAFGSGQSVLFHAANAVVAPDQWQRLVAQSFQSWANQTNLNFHRVSDTGSPAGVESPQHGDIRIGAVNYGSASGWAYHPGSGIGGDITLRATDAILTDYYTDDLFRQLVTHEAGHALGLGHSDVPNNVMGLGSSLAGPQADDIAGIRAIYGLRQDDSFDSQSRNDSFVSASSVQIEGSSIELRADLTSHADVDHYRVSIPNGTESVSVSVDARHLSLLAPKVAVYDAQQNLVATASGDYGTVATVNISGLNAGQTYTFVADGATSDEFGMGAYRLTAVLTGSVNTETAPPPVDVSPPPPNDNENNQDAADQPTRDEVVTVNPTPTQPTPTPPSIPTTPVEDTSPADPPEVVRSQLTLGSLRRLLMAGAIGTTSSNGNQVGTSVEVTSTTTLTNPVEDSTRPTPSKPTPPKPTPPKPTPTAPETPTATPTATETPALIPLPTTPVGTQLTIGSLRRRFLASTFKMEPETLIGNGPASTLSDPKLAPIEPQLATFAASATAVVNPNANDSVTEERPRNKTSIAAPPAQLDVPASSAAITSPGEAAAPVEQARSREESSREESAAIILQFSAANAKQSNRVRESNATGRPVSIPYGPIELSRVGDHSAENAASQDAHHQASDDELAVATKESHETCRPAATLQVGPRPDSSLHLRAFVAARSEWTSRSPKLVTDVGPQESADFATALNKGNVDHLFSGFDINHGPSRNAA